MNIWIKKIHIYAGLLNFSILCLFGVAGLVATAEAPDVLDPETIPAITTLPFHPPGSASDQQVGQMIWDELHLPHAGKPNVRRDAQHRLVASFYTVNGLVRATLLDGENQLQVETRRIGIWRFFDNAHSATIPQDASSGLTREVWGWYIEVSIWSLMLMALTGLWLGLTNRWPFWWTKASLLTGTVGFAIFYWAQK